MKVKKVIAVVVSLALVCGAVTGGIYGYKTYQENKLVIEVEYVADLNWGYYGDSQTSYGMLTNDSAQEIYLDEESTVEEVYVAAGDEVSIGDPLIKYDTREIEIEIRRKTLEVATIKNNIAIAEHEWKDLKEKKPMSTQSTTNSTVDYLEARIDILEDEMDDLLSLPQKDTRDSRIFNYVTKDSVPNNISTAKGTEADPYIFYCNKNAYAYGSFFQKLSSDWKGKYVKFVVVKKDANGKAVVTEKPSTEKPSTEKPSTEKPSTQKPSTEKPSTQKPSTEKPSTQKPSTEKPSTQKPSTEKPSTQKPSTQQPSTQEPSTQQPSTQEPSTQEPPVISPSSGSLAWKAEGVSVKTVDVNDTVRFTSANKGASAVYVPVADSSVSPNTVVYSENNCPSVSNSNSMWYVFSGGQIGTELARLKAELDQLEDDSESSESYTAEELKEMIADKEEELKKLDLQKRQEELKLESLESAAEDGVVYATVEGHVKTVYDLNEKPDDGTAFLVVTADDGLYVSGTISELLLDVVKPGMTVTANSWETGMTFEATITSVSDYPVENNSWGEGNPNVSYYQYTAYVEDSSSLRNGEYVDLSIDAQQTEMDSEGIYIEKAYVRQEDGKSYCMIADENDRLKKQYVVTGKTVYGSAVEIKSGLLESDRIAFPYGKNAVEGALVTEESSGY